MAEMEVYHSQKIEDFTTIAKEHLDGEIDFYEQVNNISYRPSYEQSSELD